MKKQIRLNPKKQSSARRPRPLITERKDIQHMTYRTVTTRTEDGKKRTKTELVLNVPNEPVTLPVVVETEETK